jgi:hypothetical protein
VDSRDPNYLQFVSTYIHLNPARSGLIRIGQEKLKRYRWSSYPWYLSRRCPDWLQRDKVMGSLGLDPGQVKGYEAYMEGRVLELGIKAGRKALEEKWESLRRGWYLGNDSFLEQVKARLGKLVEGLQRESHSGGARRTHDIAEAQRLLQRGMKVLQVTDNKLKELANGAPEKVALGWWLRRNTSVPLKWVSERLQMGHYTRVTQAVYRMNQGKGRRLALLRKQLLELKGEVSTP